MAHWPRLGIVVGIAALVGCGSPPPDHSASSHTTASADAVVSSSISAPSSAGLTAQKEVVGQSATPPPLLRPPGQQVPAQEALTKKDPRADDDNARVQATTPPEVPSQVNQQAQAEQAQYEARHNWLSEIRENPSASVRLMALEIWAANPDPDIDPRTFTMEDDNEQVQARALELWEKYVTQQPEDLDPAPLTQQPESQETAP
jgi:hypothetical protein